MAGFQTATPGYPLNLLLESAPEDLLRELAGGAVEVAELLEGTRLTRDRLLRLVLDLRDPVELLRDAGVRARLLPGLPPEKAVELADRLRSAGGGARQRTPQSAVRPGSAEEIALLQFFGIAELLRRPSATDLTERFVVSPDYALFDYQRDVVRKVNAALAEFPRKVVLHLPTGAGKTRSAMHIVAGHLRAHERTVVVWLAYSGELLEQAAAEFEIAWSRLGNRPLPLIRFWGSSGADLLANRDAVIIAGLQKLHAALRSDPNSVLRLADRTTLTIMDEAHQSIAPTYQELLTLLASKRPDACLLGLTATPGRTWADIEADQALADFFDQRKVTIRVEGYDSPVRFLMDEGYLAKPTFVTLNGEAGLVLNGADLASLAASLEVPQRILNRLADDEKRNLRIVAKVEELLERHRRVLVFATTVEHAELVSAVLRLRKRDALCVTAGTAPAARERAISLFRSNNPRPMVLCNFGVLTTGFDAPATSPAVIARPTRSLVLYSQMVGRAIRGPKAGGNTTCEIVTVVDPQLPGFGEVAEAFTNWEDVWT